MSPTLKEMPQRSPGDPGDRIWDGVARTASNIWAVPAGRGYSFEAVPFNRQGSTRHTQRFPLQASGNRTQTSHPNRVPVRSVTAVPTHLKSQRSRPARSHTEKSGGEQQLPSAPPPPAGLPDSPAGLGETRGPLSQPDRPQRHQPLMPSTHQDFPGVQGIRIRLPMQETQVQPLVWEDPK